MMKNWILNCIQLLKSAIATNISRELANGFTNYILMVTEQFLMQQSNQGEHLTKLISSPKNFENALR